MYLHYETFQGKNLTFFTLGTMVLTYMRNDEGKNFQQF